MLVDNVLGKHGNAGITTRIHAYEDVQLGVSYIAFQFWASGRKAGRSPNSRYPICDQTVVDVCSHLTILTLPASLLLSKPPSLPETVHFAQR
jgi:hypothetical protein